MTLEQPATLNKFVAEPIPINWASRWKRIQVFLPLLVFITICMAERLGLLMWAHYRLVPWMFSAALLPAAALLTVALASNEIALRSQGRNRLLNVLEKESAIFNCLTRDHPLAKSEDLLV